MSTELQKIELRLRKLELIIISILLLMPGLLTFFTGEVRPSISNYIYSE